jgi:hypothetical protein
MILDVSMMAAVIAVGLVVFRRFEQRQTVWQRVLKNVLVLCVTGSSCRGVG